MIMPTRGRYLSANTNSTTNSNTGSGCGICKKKVAAKGLQCDRCLLWFHISCVKMTEEQYSILGQLSTTAWFCSNCFSNRQMPGNVSDLLQIKHDVSEIKKCALKKESLIESQGVNNAQTDEHLSQCKIVGIKESHIKYPDDRAFNEKKEIENVLQKFDLIETPVIQNCYRRGKFIEGKDRPLIVKFTNTWHARTVTLQAIKNKLYQTDGILILPELSPCDKEKERKLLKKRYELLQQDIAKSSIKIKNLKLYIDGLEYIDE